MNRSQKRTVVRTSHPSIASVGPYEPFYRPNWQIFLTLSSEKRYGLFRAEPPRIGHYKEYPRGLTRKWTKKKTECVAKLSCTQGSFDLSLDGVATFSRSYNSLNNKNWVSREHFADCFSYLNDLFSSSICVYGCTISTRGCHSQRVIQK